MKLLTDVIVQTFEAESRYFKGFRIEIVSDEAAHEFGAWLYHESMGVKDFMWGVDSRTESIDSFKETVEATAEDHILSYLQEHSEF